MTSSPTYIVSNPTPGQVYYAPSAYWVVPNSGTTVTCTVQTFDASGNLHTVTSLTAIAQDFTRSLHASSYTGGNSYSASCSSSNYTNGSDIFTAAGSVGSGISQLRMYLSYTGHQYDQPPGTPTSLSPSNGNVVNTLVPALVAAFNAGTPGDTLSQYVFSMCNGSNNAGGVIYNSPVITANSYEVANNRMAHVYDGPALSFGQSYSWICRLINQNGLSSPASAFGNFSTVVAPNTPSSIIPNSTQTTLTPGFSFLYSSPAATAMQSYHWWITNTSGTTLYDNGVTTASAASGATISGSIGSGASLQYGQAYNFNVTVTDTNSATSAVGSSSFSTSALPTVSPVSPTNNATVSSTTPTFTWGFNSPNGYAQQSYQVKVYNATTGASIKDTGVITSAATSYALSGTTISYGTHIRWIVQVIDASGNASGFSSSQFAYVNNAPSATITAPANASTITTATPTITWTYAASTGGQLQASAQVVVMDVNSNVIATGAVSGAGTSYVLPVGIIVNGMSYKLQINVTDTNSVTGSSSITTFTLLYTPPADMQAQPLVTAKNYMKNPYMNVDGGTGRPVGWTGFITTGQPFTSIISIDPTVTQPVQFANGDGNVTGAHLLAVTASTASGFVNISTHEDSPVSQNGFIPGTTHVSCFAYCQVLATSGTPQAQIGFTFQDGSFTTLASYNATSLNDTGGAIVQYLGPQNILVPVGTVHIYVELKMLSPTSNDLGYVWWMDAQLEAALFSDTNFIAGDLGTGYAYDTNGFSSRTFLPGGLPSLISNPGAANDPLGSNGGTLTLSWDTSLADTRFLSYIIDRRRQDQATDDTAWVTLATLSSSSISSYTDYTAGSNAAYQYAIRQTITYTDSSVGISFHRAIVTGFVSFSPAWYLTNVDGVVYNFRCNVVDVARNLLWKESAVYSQFMGRAGQARDAGPALGYAFDLVIYFNDAWGDTRSIIRRQLVLMQMLNVEWYLKDPEGLVVPVHIGNIDFPETDTFSDTLMKATLHLLQSRDTGDF